MASRVGSLDNPVGNAGALAVTPKGRSVVQVDILAAVAQCPTQRGCGLEEAGQDTGTLAQGAQCAPVQGDLFGQPGQHGGAVTIDQALLQQALPILDLGACTTSTLAGLIPLACNCAAAGRPGGATSRIQPLSD